MAADLAMAVVVTVKEAEVGAAVMAAAVLAAAIAVHHSSNSLRHSELGRTRIQHCCTLDSHSSIAMGIRMHHT